MYTGGPLHLYAGYLNHLSSRVRGGFYTPRIFTSYILFFGVFDWKFHRNENLFMFQRFLLDRCNNHQLATLLCIDLLNEYPDTNLFDLFLRQKCALAWNRLSVCFGRMGWVEDPKQTESLSQAKCAWCYNLRILILNFNFISYHREIPKI